MPKEPAFVPTIGCMEVLTFQFCDRCNRQTIRRVYPDDRLGACMGCDPNCQTKAQQRWRARQERERLQPRLFEP